MAARLQRSEAPPIPTDDESPPASPPTPAASRPRYNYFKNQQDTDPFPDPFLLQPQHEVSDEEESLAALQAMLDQAQANGFLRNIGMSSNRLFGSMLPNSAPHSLLHRPRSILYALNWRQMLNLCA